MLIAGLVLICVMYAENRERHQAGWSVDIHHQEGNRGALTKCIVTVLAFTIQV